MTIHLYENDLPETVQWSRLVAIDTEAMGLNPHRDRLCLVQLSFGDGIAHLVQIKDASKATHLKKLLSDSSVEKIFHFARFDVAALAKTFGVMCSPIFCTKIASKLVRTYTERHGLKDLCRELLGVELSKQEQSSDWGAPVLTLDQQKYAASDVLHLHQLRSILIERLERENRLCLAQQCFGFLPALAQLDLLGWEEKIFEH